MKEKYNLQDLRIIKTRMKTALNEIKQLQKSSRTAVLKKTKHITTLK